MAQHTVRAFDDELAELRARVVHLGDTVQAELDQALEVLVSGDRARAAQVLDMDAKADELEREVQMQVLRVLARYQPVANDLREVIAAERLSVNLERVGDHAKTVAKQVIRLGNDEGWLDDAAPVQRFGGRVRELLATALRSYRENDLAAATEAWTGDVEVDEAFDDVFHGLLVAMQEGNTTIANGTKLLFAAKSLERIGDHATNVAEEVRFILTGRLEDRHAQAQPA